MSVDMKYCIGCRFSPENAGLNNICQYKFHPDEGDISSLIAELDGSCLKFQRATPLTPPPGPEQKHVWQG
jgi:hypothetical protein